MGNVYFSTPDMPVYQRLVRTYPRSQVPGPRFQSLMVRYAQRYRNENRVILFNMAYGTNTTDVKYRWSEVCGAFFRRYPNPWSKHVLSEDVISREVKGPVVRTVRVIIKKNKVPRILQSFFTGRASDGLYIEESYINRDTRTVISYTRTFSFRSLGLFDERCSYTPSQNRMFWTSLKREAWATGNNRTFFTRQIEKVVVSRYSSEAKKSSKGLNYVLQQLYPSSDKIPRTILGIPKLPKKITCEQKECE